MWPLPQAARLALAAVIALSLSACPDNPRLTVKVCTDMQVPGELDAIRVSTLDPSHQQEITAGVVELVNCEGGVTIEQPPVEYGIGAPEGEFWLVVQGLRAGAPVITIETRLRNGLSDDETVTVALPGDCRGVQCPLGQTCGVDGTCRLAPFVEEESWPCLSPGGGGTDAGGDASPADASTPDTGPDVAPGDVDPYDGICSQEPDAI